MFIFFLSYLGNVESFADPQPVLIIVFVVGALTELVRPSHYLCLVSAEDDIHSGLSCHSYVPEVVARLGDVSFLIGVCDAACYLFQFIFIRLCGYCRLLISAVLWHLLLRLRLPLRPVSVSLCVICFVSLSFVLSFVLFFFEVFSFL